jgi:hypothetical protein
MRFDSVILLVYYILLISNRKLFTDVSLFVQGDLGNQGDRGETGGVGAKGEKGDEGIAGDKVSLVASVCGTCSNFRQALE